VYGENEKKLTGYPEEIQRNKQKNTATIRHGKIDDPYGIAGDYIRNRTLRGAATMESIQRTTEAYASTRYHRAILSDSKITLKDGHA
jgi:hypothetical protein